MGNRIGKLRKEKGWSLAELAERVSVCRGKDVHLTTIDKIEKGRQKLNVEWMEVIAPALGVTLGDLLEGKTAKSSLSVQDEAYLTKAFLAMRDVLARLQPQVTSKQEVEILLVAYRLLADNPQADLEKGILYHLANNPVRNCTADLLMDHNHDP